MVELDGAGEGAEGGECGWGEGAGSGVGVSVGVGVGVGEGENGFPMEAKVSRRNRRNAMVRNPSFAIRVDVRKKKCKLKIEGTV